MHEPLVCDAPVYRNCRAEATNAKKILNSSLIIPSHEKLTSDQIQYIIDAIFEFENGGLA
jgi:dTDP-4-amino-4,6-dideoxygalactose transaminase